MNVFQTPILFLVFNRPDTTRKVFQVIKQIRPATLFVAADGPRSSREGELELCNKVRQIIDEGIDWNCNVHKLYRDENLGCGKAVSGALDWFFGNVEEGIILEDDTLPDITFFSYCDMLLEKYRDTIQIMMVSGNNFRLENNNIIDSYTFTKYCSIWGWATWRRAWKAYDFEMEDWPKWHESGLLQQIFSDDAEVRYWEEVFNKTYNGIEDTWDYQWYYAFLKNNGLAVEPSVNLVMNIGFRDDATHTTGTSSDYLFGNILPQQLIIEKHPDEIVRDTAGDKITFKNRYLNGFDPSPKKYTLKDWLLNNLSRVKNYLFPNTSFKLGQKLHNAKRSIDLRKGT